MYRVGGPTPPQLKLMDPALAHVCAVCGKPAPLQCARCSAAAYCGRECQVADWRAGHKAVCDVVAADIARQSGGSGSACAMEAALRISREGRGGPVEEHSLGSHAPRRAAIMPYRS